MRIVLYDPYHVIPHPPMKFQVDTLSFGWILEAMPFQLPVVFHLCLSYSKSHALK